MAGRGSKPGERRGGRQPGTPNKITAGLKAAIEGALNTVGGQGYLERVAVRYPAVFCMLLARIIPKDLHVSLPMVHEGDKKDSMFDTARRLCFVLQAGGDEAARRAATGRSAKRRRRTHARE